MNITKAKLKQIILEELSGLLNEEEAQEEAQEQTQEAPKLKSDVAAVGDKVGKVSGIEKLFSRINNRAEFEQMATALINQASKNVDINDQIQALKNIIKNKSKSK